jgi:MFS family permease
MIGSALSGFALGVYVYRQTGSVVTLGLIYALAFLPLILASPFAGSVVDRFGPRWGMIASSTGSMLVMLTLALLLVTHAFATWQVYVIVTVNSALRALQMPAFAASVPLLVPKREIGRANGMRTIGLAASQVLAPVAAGFMLLAIHIYGIILIDCVSYGLAIATLLLISIPTARHTEPMTAISVLALLKEFMVAWRYVADRCGLLALLAFIVGINFCGGFADLLIIPLVLAFGTPGALGAVLSIGGTGMIVASVAMSARGGPRRRVRGLYASSLMMAIAIVIGSARPNVALVATAAFFFLGALAIIISTHQGIWQTKVEPQLLGRVLALVNMVGSVPQLLAYALAGLAADLVFVPLVGRDHVRSHLLALLVGNGPGRGFALLLMSTGALVVVLTVLAAMSARLRHLEEELPDVTPEDLDDAAGGAGRKSDSARV